jgi:hypothetical protein
MSTENPSDERRERAPVANLSEAEMRDLARRVAVDEQFQGFVRELVAEMLPASVGISRGKQKKKATGRKTITPEKIAICRKLLFGPPD